MTLTKGTTTRVNTMTATKVGKKRYSVDFIVNHLCAFYKTPRTMSFNKFFSNRNVKTSNLGKIWRASGLHEMKKNKEEIDKAMDTLTKYLENRTKDHKKKMKDLHKGREYLTDGEVQIVLHLAKILGSMGYGIDKAVCNDIITSIIKIRLPTMDVQVSPSVLDLMMKKHSEFVQLIHGNAVDPARIRQATSEVRDSEFYKIEAYIEMLYKMGKIPWRTYKDIPKQNLYNADKVTTNTYDHRRKVIGTATTLGRIFQITPGGDGRMPFHITCMLTSCSTGIYKVPIEGIKGSPPPMIIHACSASPDKQSPSDLQTSNEEFFQHPRYSDGLAEPYSAFSVKGDVKKNPWGFCVRTSNAGSMT